MTTPEEPSTEVPEPGPEPEVLTPEEQKEKLASIGDEFISEISMSNWQSAADEISSTVLTITNILEDEDFDNSAVFSWLDDLGDIFVQESSEIPSMKAIHRENRVTRTMIQLSQIKGHFKMGASAWEYTEADDLQVSLKNDDGKDVLLTMASTEQDTPTFIFKDSWMDNWYYDYNYETGEWNEGYEYSYEDYYSIYVPKTVDCVLTIGGKTMASVNLVVNYSDNDHDGMLDSGDFLEETLKSTVADYSVENKTTYKKTTVSSEMAVKHNAKTLSSVKLEGKGITHSPEIDGQILDTLESFDGSFESISLSADILGKLSLSLSSDKGKELIDTFIKYADSEDVSEIREGLDKIESLIETAVYYDGDTSKSQATIGFEIVEDEYGDFMTEPVIRFEDGSSQSDLSAFFDDETFSKLIESFEKFIEEIENYFD